MSRILMVLPTWPWPVRSGDGRRVVAVLDALETAGHEVEVLCLLDPQDPIDRHAAPRPASSIAFPRRRVGRAERLRWLLAGGPPLALLGRDPTVVRLEAGPRIEAFDPEVVWCNRLDAWWAAAPLLTERTVVVDTVDLESRKETSRLAAGRDTRTPRSWRRTAARWQGRRTVRAWRRLELAAASQATMAVCSAEEAAVVPGAVVIPNTYPAPPVPLGTVAVGHPPTVMLTGLLTYPPNADGARWLVDEVLPALRVEVPDVEVRLVGRAGDDLWRLHDPPRVSVVGFAEDLDAELAKADVAVVPVRYGGGTRVKVLEAWAHGIPVVGTSVGVEGLGATDGRDALIADDADAFAQACARALSDLGLRRHLVACGWSRHRAAFAAPRLATAVAAALAKATAERTVRSSS